MIKRCNFCNLETNQKNCPVCGGKTAEDIPTEIYRCRVCNIPVIQQAAANDKNICPICGRRMDYMAADLRPVFPEEIQLLAILFQADLQSWLSSSIWATDSKYYIEGETFSLSSKDLATADVNDIAKKL